MFIFLLQIIFCVCALPLHAGLAQSEFRFLTNDLSVVDGRPVFSGDGKTIVFMRQPNDQNPDAPSQLYSIPTNAKKAATPLFDNINPNTGKPFNATRPDYSWCRCTYQIAFDAGDDGIWLLDLKSKNVKQVLQTNIDGNHYTWSYPCWYPNGKYLSVTNYNNDPAILYHTLVKAKVSSLNDFTILTNNQVVWPGMSSVSQKKPNYLAYAAELPVPQPPAPCSCIGNCTPDGYAQNCNQIWLQKSSITNPIDNKQGRAPWFSPDGKYIVFESNRDNPDFLDRYRLYIYSLEENTVKPITPDALNVQHGKWSPDGKMIVFAVQLFGGAQGIALVTLK
ncbi:MAG: hypothetical protein LLF94_10790 [Chlamydiales bacterium]|nr:hypothetical protein [Chlamydiales bacterium]